MRVKKEYIILFFVIAVLVFYITSQKKEETHYTLPEVAELNTEEVTRILVSTRDSEVELVRSGENWVVGNEQYRADRALVDKMLRSLQNIRLGALASESGNYLPYELDEDRRLTVAAFKGDKAVRKLSVGKAASSFRHTFVMLDDDHRVYHADGNIRGDFDRTVDQLRDRRVMTVKEEITALTLRQGDLELNLVRKEEAPAPDEAEEDEKEEKQAVPTITWTTGDGKNVKQAEVEEIVSSLSDLTCDGFLPRGEREGLGTPVYSVTLKGAKHYSLSIFDMKENQYPAISSEHDYPFLLSEWKAKKIMKDLSSLPQEGQTN